MLLAPDVGAAAFGWGHAAVVASKYRLSIKTSFVCRAETADRSGVHGLVAVGMGGRSQDDRNQCPEEGAYNVVVSVVHVLLLSCFLSP